MFPAILETGDFKLFYFTLTSLGQVFFNTKYHVAFWRTSKISSSELRVQKLCKMSGKDFYNSWQVQERNRFCSMNYKDKRSHTMSRLEGIIS